METRIKGVLSPKASGSITITENGNYDVVDVANAVVDVRPSGTIEITENGEHDVANYEKAVVDVKFDKKTIKDLLDITQSCYEMFNNKQSLTSIEGLFEYNDTENVTTMYNMFCNCRALTSIPLLNTKNVTNMEYFAENCYKVSTPIKLDTSNVTTLSSAFYSCYLVPSIELTDTSKVTNMRFAFAECYALTEQPKLNTENVTSFCNIFRSCRFSKIKLATPKATDLSYLAYSSSYIEIVDLSYYNITSQSNGISLESCGKLKALIIREFGSSYLLKSGAFKMSGIANGKGYIYVPRAMVDTLKSATNWSTYANQIRALEDYTIDGTTTGELDESKLV